MGSALLRQWEMLRAIPREGRGVKVSKLLDELRSRGHKVSRRSIQRDLDDLSTVFPLTNDGRSTPSWYWLADADPFDLPAMDSSAALLLKILEQHSPQLLPPTLSNYLRPYFSRATKILADDAPPKLGTWLNRVRVIPQGMPLQPPRPLSEEATRIVYTAVLEQRRFKALYRSRGQESGKSSEYDVNPLGLVVRGPLVYLVCTLRDYPDIRQLALHRFERAELQEAEATPPPGFDLDAYVRSGAFEVPYGPSIRVRLRVARSVANHLEEMPLAEDQDISAVEGDLAVVSATVPDSGQLRWWLMGFGDLVEVLEPAALRLELAATLESAARRYQPSTKR